MAHAAPNQIVVKMWPADSGSVKNCDFLEVIKSKTKKLDPAGGMRFEFESDPKKRGMTSALGGCIRRSDESDAN